MRLFRNPVLGFGDLRRYNPLKDTEDDDSG